MRDPRGNGKVRQGRVLRRLARDPRPLKVSFEFSPPKTDEAEEKLWLAIRRLEPLNPAFVSVTYGAGGSTRERTHATVARIQRETTMNAAAHLTCVEAIKAELAKYPDAKVRWVQDEPYNQGPWPSYYLNVVPQLDRAIEPITRQASSTTAVGTAKRHLEEAKVLIGEAFA